jgi:hypothetical protein
LAKGTKIDVSEDETWPSSMTKRFHLICKKAETFGIWHLQLGTRNPGYSEHIQGRSECSFAMSELLNSALNPIEKNSRMTGWLGKKCDARV